MMIILKRILIITRRRVDRMDKIELMIYFKKSRTKAAASHSPRRSCHLAVTYVSLYTIQASSQVSRNLYLNQQLHAYTRQEQ